MNINKNFCGVFVAMAALCGAAMFAGCGDDNSASVNDEQSSSSVESPASSSSADAKSSSSSKEDKTAESSSSVKDGEASGQSSSSVTDPLVEKFGKCEDKGQFEVSHVQDDAGNWYSCYRGEWSEGFLEVEGPEWGHEPGERSSSSSQNVLLNPNIQYDSIVDSRDGRVYRTVKIGDQQWMAENMNYGVYQDCFDDQGERCVDDTCSCTKYGRLYTWFDATDDLCVSGWHLPTKDDFEKLFVTVGGDSIAGRMLKSMSDWKSDNNGDDSYGFTALPAGYRFTSGGSYGVYNNADFWCSTESTHQKAYYANLNYKNDVAIIGEAGKSEGFSIRCIKD